MFKLRKSSEAKAVQVDRVTTAESMAELVDPMPPGTATASPSMALVAQPQVSQSLDGLALLREHEAEFRGLLPTTAIPASLRDSVMLVTMSMVRVGIVAKKGANQKAQYSNVRQGLKNYRIAFEVTLTDDEYDTFGQEMQNRRGSSFHVPTEDDRGKRLFEELIQEAFRLGASDIHFRLREQGESDVRLRLFGRMRPWQNFDSITLINAVASAYSSKTKFGTNSRSGFELGVESSTITEHFFSGKTVMGRFAHRPILGGGKTVLRLLETASDSKKITIKSFSDLGYASSHIDDQIMPALHKNTGLILVAGSTGSGKSTTLRSMMHSIPGLEQLEMYSVEDPTEYVMPWVNQISIQSSADDSDEVRRSKFLSSLRSMMRMDPDVAMIGEIRDTESARIATELTQTGHRVLSTVHGDGAIDVMARLTGDLLQVQPDILAGKRYLSACIYQKLMPLLCPHCKLPARKVMTGEMQQVLAKKFHIDTERMFCADEDGCSHCRLPGINTEGTRGQTVVAEIITPDNGLRKAIAQKDWIEMEMLWRGTRKSAFDQPDMTGKTAFEHALYKASEGLIDPRDLALDFQPFETYDIVAGTAESRPDSVFFPSSGAKHGHMPMSHVFESHVSA